MITPGSYMYIKGTNIEVGIRRVSYDPKFPYAACTFRYGRYRWSIAQQRMYSKRDPIHLQVQKIPIDCLTYVPDFTKRGYLKSSFKSTDECPLNVPKVSEGIFVEEEQPYYKSVREVDGKYFVLLKGMTQRHFDIGDQNTYSVFGLKELTFPFKFFDEESQVITFDTEPVRKAHISVVRSYKSMAHLKGHSQSWSSSWNRRSLRDMTAPADVSYISGTSIICHTLIQGNKISFCKMNTYYSKYDILTQWIPHVQMTTSAPVFSLEGDENQFVRIKEGLLSNGVYVNGLPYKFIAAVPENHPLLTEDHQSLLDREKEKYPEKEYFSGQEEMMFIYLYRDIKSNFRDYMDKDATKWKCFLKNISSSPDAGYNFLQNYRHDETIKYLDDYKTRSNNTHYLKPVAVKV
jgi:hypothetical protein